jgi:hypothetical protein
MANANTQLAVPDYMAARIAARKQQAGSHSTMTAIIGGDGFSFPKISTRASRFRLVEDGVETQVGVNLDVVIVGANPKVSKIFYAKPYDSSAEGVRPDCFSNDGVRPDASVQSPVNASCADCPHNVLGSKVNPSGAKSKLCGDQRHLAVVPAADPNKVYGLTITVSAMKNLREYFKELQNFGAEPEDVVTELGFDDQASFPKVTFNRKGFVPEKALAKVDTIVNSDDVKEVTRVIPPRAKATALAAPEAAAALAAPVAAPVVDEAYEEESAPTPAPQAAKAAKPKTEPVKASSELESKLDSLFAE